MNNQSQNTGKRQLKLVWPLRRNQADVVGFAAVQPREQEWIRERRKKAELPPGDPARDAVGLSMSGGGIRSAIFGLGLLQSLERYGLLKHVDYLSTVSGGGYIGASLTWFKSVYGPKEFPFGTRRKDHSGHPGQVLHWLRTHGSYLSPGSGMTGWTLGGALAMGMLVNFFIIVPPVLLLFYFLSRSVVLFGETMTVLGAALIPAAAAIAAFVVGVMTVAVIPGAFGSPRNEKWIRVELGRLLKSGVLLALFGAIPFLDSFLTAKLREWVPTVAGTVSGAAAVLAALRGRTEQNEGKRWRSFLLATGLLLLVYGLCLGAFHLALAWPSVPGMLIWHVLLALVLAAYADINMVSMHRFYRDRLWTAFIALPEAPASPQPKLQEKSKAGPEQRQETQKPLRKVIEKIKAKYAEKNPLRRECRLSELRISDAPYHLINTILQTVGSKDQKLCGRGGDSFTLSPLYCGSPSTGYRTTKTYQDGRLDLATAVAISGAAVDPNTYMTRKTGLRMLMTLLNLRLGYWITSPRFQPPNFLTRPFWWNYVIREGMGRLDESRSEIHLSDGGGFENLGVYELIRRRCHVIIVSDATEDSNSAFSELARSIELARVDFGVKIEINVDELIADSTPQRRAKSAFKIGRIFYEDTDKDAGHLIYINTALTENLMADLYSYARRNPCFPEESTVDQYFDERQFEAYRELGYQIGRALCNREGWSTPAELVEAVQSKRDAAASTALR